MLVLSTLCFLLPLVSSQSTLLSTCDSTKAAAFLDKTQLEGNLLDNFGDKRFWFVASAADGSDSSVYSVEVYFGSVSSNSVLANFVYRDSNGNITRTISSTYNLEGDHILAHQNNVALYYFKCSDNLIAAYRCTIEGATTPVYGQQYYIWAAWDQSYAAVGKELTACETEIREEDPTVTFLYRVHP